MSASDTILETRGLTKEFKGFVAVSDVNLKVVRGTIHALIGPNGAGKTTCFNLLTKFLTPTRGQILFNGEDITRDTPEHIARRGIVRSYQISSVFPHLTVLENVRIALQRPTGLSFQFWRSERSLDHLNERAHGPAGPGRPAARSHRAPTVSLPYGRKRALEIATTLAMEPELMLLDEPTQGMGHEDVARVTELIKQVAAGRTVLMVEHNMNVVSSIADTITVLRAAPCSPKARTPRCRGTRRSWRPTWARPTRSSKGSGTDMATALEIKNLHAWYGESHILHGVDLHVNQGEVVTLLGRNGAGRTTTLRAIMGLTGARKGSIKVNGTETIGMPTHRIAHLGIGYCPEERGIFASLSCEENLLLPPRVAAEGGMSIDEIYAMFPNLKERAKSQGTRLSGGEQQMLAVARILRTGAHLLLLDEISEGLAPVIVAKLGEMIRMLKAKGYTIVMVEQNFRFAAPLADRFYVMEHGRIVETFAAAQLREKEATLHELLGV